MTVLKIVILLVFHYVLFLLIYAYFSFQNKRPSVPRNIGIDLTSTSHIIFLDCDDILTFQIDDYHKEWSSSPETLLGHAYYWNDNVTF